MNHGTGAGSIARPVDQQFSAVPLSCALYVVHIYLLWKKAKKSNQVREKEMLCQHHVLQVFRSRIQRDCSCQESNYVSVNAFHEGSKAHSADGTINSRD